MKKYSILYWHEDRSKPEQLTELSKTGIENGVSIAFNEFDDYKIKKWSQIKIKNNNLHGLSKHCRITSPEVDVFQNWKKSNIQGIQISFKWEFYF